MLEIKKSDKLLVKIFDVEYFLNKPSFGQIEKMQLELKSNDASVSFTVMKNFLLTVGLPVEVISELEVEHLNDIIYYLTNVKKK